MTEEAAWELLYYYASQGKITIARSMSVRALRRQLAKVYQPRRPTDDDAAMRKINPALDLIDEERDRRELLGIQEDYTEPERPFDGVEPWQTDPDEPTTILHRDFTDANFIKKTIYERSILFGDARLMKAWAWDGQRFRKIISVYANQFANEELGRALLVWQKSRGNAECDAIFLTEGNGPATSFRLVILRTGRSYDNVFPYNFELEGNPYDQQFETVIPSWLNVLRTQLNQDSML